MGPLLITVSLATLNPLQSIIPLTDSLSCESHPPAPACFPDATLATEQTATLVLFRTIILLLSNYFPDDKSASGVFSLFAESPVCELLHWLVQLDVHWLWRKGKLSLFQDGKIRIRSVCLWQARFASLNLNSGALPEQKFTASVRIKAVTLCTSLCYYRIIIPLRKSGNFRYHYHYYR